MANLMMAVIHSLSGCEEQARLQVEKVLKISPKFTPAKFKKKLTYKRDADRERFLSTLRKAGISEHVQLSTIWLIGQSEIFKGDHTDRTCYDS